jgi:hypothetical protein
MKICNCRLLRISKTAVSSVLACIGLAPAPAMAAEPLLLAGGEIAEAAYYSYVGIVLPLGTPQHGRGWFQRYWLDRYGYEYDGAPGRVEADAYGAEAALGYGGSNEAGWWGVSLGVRYTDTTLEPDDPAANGRGSQFGGKLQVDVERKLTAGWRLGGIASYSNEQNAYWGRARLTRDAQPTRVFGLEAVANGNDEADATAAGCFVAFHPAAAKWSIGLKAGFRFQDDADGAYGGVELGYAF